MESEINSTNNPQDELNDAKNIKFEQKNNWLGYINEHCRSL